MKAGDTGIMRGAENAVSNLAAAGAAVLLAAAFVTLAAGAYLNAAAARKTAKAAVDGYGELRRRFDGDARARHDFHKHMAVLKKMLSDGQTERAIVYLDTLSDSVGQQTETVYTGNYMIDLILNGSLSAARDSGVRIDVTAASVPETLAISDSALSGLLCNALDNAAAAALAGGGDGWIRVELHGKGEMLYIGISNSCPETAAPGGGPFRRGYGQKIMRQIVARWHGVMKAEQHGDTYLLSLLLPVHT